MPSKRARKIPEKIQVSKEDLAELSATASPDVGVEPETEIENNQAEVSLDQVSEAEDQAKEVSPEDTEANS